MPKYKKNVPTNTISRDMVRLSQDTENIYETVMIIAKRANQIAAETKQELETRLQEVAVFSDDAQEIFENQEQIELSRQYERMPKPTLIAAKEYEDGDLYYNIAVALRNNPFPFVLSYYVATNTDRLARLSSPSDGRLRFSGYRRLYTARWDFLVPG